MKDADRRLFSQRTKGTRVSSTAKTVPCPYFILPAFLLASWFAVAQDQAALTGVVVDPKGASIPGAKLTLTGKATGETRKAVADGEGRFDFKDLPPGKYSLKAMMKGFEEVEMLTSVGSETPAPLRVKMRIRLSEEITVTADR